MSFWGGVAKGLEAGEAKREREEVRDTAAARNALQDKRWQMQWENTLAQQTKANERAELADARLLEAHGLAMAKGTLGLTQSINNLAGGTSGGTGSTGGARSPKSGPTPGEMNTGARALQARIDALGGLESMTAADQAYYKPILGNAAASYELNKLLAKAVGDDTDLTILNAAERVRTVAIVAAQGQEAFAAYSKKAAKDGWNPDNVLEAMELAKKVNPDFAELVLLTPSNKNLTEQEQFKTFEAGIQFYIADWVQNNPDKVTDAFTTAKSQLTSSNDQIKMQGLSTLVSMGVGQDWILKNTKEGNALHNLIPKEVSAVPKVDNDGNLVTGGGGAVPPGTPTYTAAELLELPPAEARKLVGTRIIVDGKPGTYGIPGTSTFGGQTGASDDPKAAGQRGANIEEGFVMPEVAAEGVTTALLAGQKTGAALATVFEAVKPDGELSASYLNATDTMTSALNRGAANAADFISGVMGGTEQTSIAEWLRADADRIDAKTEATAESVRKKNLQIAEAYVDGMNGWFGGLFSTETKVEATENVANVLTRGSDTPAAKALLETIQERVDYARSKRKEKPTSPQVTEEGLMSQRLDDTNRRIAEEDMAMSRPVPQPLGTIAFNGPTAEDGLMSMPVEQAGGFEEVMQSLATASDEEKSVILSKYIGEDGLPIRKPDYAGGRLADTNKRIAEEDAAMAVDFPQPLKDIVLKARSSGEEKFQPATMAATELNTPVIQKALSIVSTVVGPEVAAVLATGFQPDTLGSPELNTPAIQQALTVVGEKVDPEVAAIIAVGFKPATMGATELNTPAVREAIANVPTEVKEAVEAIITTGNESDIEQAASEVAAEFGESVAAILFDDLKSARGTGKSAMMSGLQ
jgi:hypothetical protein